MRNFILCMVVFALFGWSCATNPQVEKPQFTYHYYTYSVLLDPSKPAISPKLEIALSLMQMEAPAEQASYIQEILYGGLSMEEYKEEVIRQQRERYRKAAPADAFTSGNSADYNWYYSETIDVADFKSPSWLVIHSPETAGSVQPHYSGIVLERTIRYSSGGSVLKNKQFLNINLDDMAMVKLTDFFVNFQEEIKLRDIVYDELRKYSDLGRRQDLSEGIYYSDHPELSFNFFITYEGLGLYWGTDQIAPPSAGDIQVILPWQAIRPLMLFTGIELLTKFNIYLFM